MYQAQQSVDRAVEAASRDPQAPVYHFRAPANWMNDIGAARAVRVFDMVVCARSGTHSPQGFFPSVLSGFDFVSRFGFADS